MSADDTSPVDTDHAPVPLVRALSEIEQHVRSDGWDQPPRLYALAETNDLLAREPALAAQLGIDHGSVATGLLTPIEQEIGERSLDDLLASIAWPETVDGCALAVERIVLPPGVEDEMPDDETDAVTWAQRHPSRADVRVIVGVLRDGTRSSVLRVRGHEDETDLIVDAELSPELGDALVATFA
ncbi:MAG: PPA1309 family protein [Jiangellaceae bacterium]